MQQLFCRAVFFQAEPFVRASGKEINKGYLYLICANALQERNIRVWHLAHTHPAHYGGSGHFPGKI